MALVLPPHAFNLSHKTDHLHQVGLRRQPVIPRMDIVFTKSKGPSDFSQSQSGAQKGSPQTAGSSRKRRRSKQESEDEQQPTVAGRRKTRRQRQTSTVQSPPRRSPVATTIPNGTLLEHIATSRFFYHYLSAKPTFYCLALDFTSDIIDHASSRSALAEVVIGLGILTLPHKMEAVCTAARLRYSRALRFINRSLADPEEVKKDEVLMAIILLGLFETTPHDENSAQNWTAHLDGARMLLRLRGKEMLQDGPAYRMFCVLRQQILLNCLVTCQAVPEDLIDLSSQISDEQHGDQKAASGVSALFARLCDFLATSRSGEGVDRNAAIANASKLNEDLISWAESLPSNFDYTIEAVDTTIAYEGRCHVYSSLFSAEVWNLYRNARMAINGILMEQYAMMNAMDPEDMSTQAQMGNCLGTLKDLQYEICASIPFLLDRHGSQPSRIIDLPLCKRTPVMQQLFYIAKTPGIPDDMSAWMMALATELQSEQDVDKGAIWMGKKITKDH